MQSRKPIARKFKSSIKNMLRDLRLNDKGDFEDWLNYEYQLVTEWEQDLQQRELKHLPDISFNDFLKTKK